MPHASCNIKIFAHYCHERTATNKSVKVFIKSHPVLYINSLVPNFQYLPHLLKSTIRQLADQTNSKPKNQIQNRLNLEFGICASFEIWNLEF
jgi:hypothetical protein